MVSIWQKVSRLSPPRSVSRITRLVSVHATFHHCDGFESVLIDLDVASRGWDMLFQYHGRPSGIYAADEYLAGLEAVRG